MNIEEIRLQTFTNWPNEAPVEAWRIAKGGFFATGNGLEVQCHWCGSKISEWEYGEPVCADWCYLFVALAYLPINWIVFVV